MSTPPIRHSSRNFRIVVAVGAVATIHFVVWLALFRAAFHAIDTGESFPIALGLLLNVLGIPLMLLLDLSTSAAGTSTLWWGDDARFIIALAVPNSLIWGWVAAWTYRCVRRRGRNG